MEELLEQLLEDCRPYTQQGKVATYIPELANGDANDLGIYVLRSDGRHYQAGDYKKRFTIQSVVKPILLLLALMDNGEEYVRSRVGVEATGKPFVVVANKQDKIKKSEWEPNLARIRETLALDAQTPVISFSAEKGLGKEELLGVILDHISADTAQE